MSEYISVSQLSEKINFAPMTIYRWVKARKIPFVKFPGNDIRFAADRIDEWIESRTIKSKKIGQ